MSAPAVIPLTIYQGATFRSLCTWKAGTPAVPVDLTGCTARMQIRPAAGSPTVLASLTTENGGISLGGSSGTVAIYISADETAGFSWSAGYYDLEVEFLSGDVRRLLSGKVKVSQEVTRD